MIPLEFLEALANKFGISDIELEVLSLAIEGESMAAIATKLNTSSEAVRKRLSEVYKKFRITGAGPGKLARLQQILVSLYQENQVLPHLSPNVELDDREEINANSRQDWGEAPESSAFYGRTEEIATLEQWIVKDRCRLVAILGMGGIGKTSLAVKLAKQIQGEFKYVIWRSLRRAISVNNLLDEIIPRLSHQQKVYLPEDVDSKISQLIEHLRRHRCLLVLDDIEAILSNGVAGHYREGYEKYGELLQRVGEQPHQSCLVIISLEKPREVGLLERDNISIRSLLLQGLKKQEASEILSSRGLAQANEWETLIKVYRGNPLSLKIISTTIHELFDGSVTDFLGYDTLVVGDINNLLYQQFQRLSELEKDIMYFLAIEQEPVPLSKLTKQLFIPIPLSDLLAALDSLSQRSLIEKSQESGDSFTLQPVIMEYVTNQLVEQICREIRTQQIDKIRSLKNHILIKTHNDTEEVQASPILTRIKNKLRTIFRSEKLIESKLTEMRALLQENSPLEVGYASDNVRNLLMQLKTNSRDRLK